MNKITLITSEGCLGCQVMKNSITSALSQTNVDVTVETIAIKDADKKLIKRFNITDTPCTMFFKDDKYLFKKIGSIPAVVVVQWINVHYK